MPRTGAALNATGIVTSGVTTIVYGSESLYGAYVVLGFTQRPIVDNTKLPGGLGLTSTRVQLIDGVEWSITVRDDTTMTPPRPGTVIPVIDQAGLLGTPGAATTARVTDAQYSIAPKQAGERVITAERLTNFV